MAKDIMYRQCNLERQHADGTVTRTTSWIPEIHKGIKIEPGVRVTLKDHGDKQPVAGGMWTVKSVSWQAITEKVAKERAHNWKDHRKFSDI